MSGNQALNTNNGIGGSPNLQITTHGSDWYWAVCAVMSLTAIGIMATSFTKPRVDRVFHYLSAALCFTAAIAYYSMASGLGQTGIQEEFVRSGLTAGTREIFWVRYIDWFVTTPLLLLDLLLTAGLPTATILAVIFADEVMVVTGLVGALTRSSYKWGYWTFGMVALGYVLYVLLGHGRSYARAVGPNPYKAYMTCGVFLSFIWLLYPIAWGLSEGGNVIHPDSEAVFYGVLDVLAKPVFSMILLFLHRPITSAELGMNVHDYTLEGAPTEKRGLFNRGGARNGAANGASNGHNNGVADHANGATAAV